MPLRFGIRTAFTVFASTFGFPDFSRGNMNAWIDCMTDLSEDTGMTTVHGSETGPVVFCVDDVDKLPAELFDALNARASSTGGGSTWGSRRC
jgi:hypothetical protein